MRYLSALEVKAVECKNCHRVSELIAEVLGICGDCIRKDFSRVATLIAMAHARTRRAFRLPEKPPKEEKAVKCTLCGNECQIPAGERGFCGLRTNREGKMVHLAGTKREGVLDWYYDPLPTNCVADWVCPGGLGAGYPRYAHSRGPEYGYQNLAVFYRACSFNCLFCQNWHFRKTVFARASRLTAEELAEKVDSRTSCICFFGGDPAPQMPHALTVSKIARSLRPQGILRICWETNGSMHPSFLRKAVHLSLESGGCIKFDLKAGDENLHYALTGTSNQRTLENFRYAANLARERREPPLVIASTLLVPGYVDAQEVRKIATFIASLDPEIPYSLLAFYPHFYFYDLPTTSRHHAQECYRVAREAGLKNVHLGNIHLLSNDY